MASKSLGTLTLDIVAKVGGFTSGLDKSSREFDKWQRKFKSDAVAVGKTLGVAVVAGATAAAAGISILVKRQLEAIDAQADMAKRLCR